MSAPVLPWLAGAVIQLLREDAAFMATCGSRVDSRAPSDVGRPFALVRVAGNVHEPGSGGISWLPLLQVEGRSPVLTDRDVDGVVWEIAANAARVLATVDMKRWRNIGYTARLTDGPAPLPLDTTRGTSMPLHGAYCRAELSVQVVPT
ncbi:MAG: hypothetical protein M3443_18335 [Actinomycetota bacterium]|nr:hypothetical protein [Actinomycetota bacterium]